MEIVDCPKCKQHECEMRSWTERIYLKCNSCGYSYTWKI